MNPIDPCKFSLDYLIENKEITILSRDYVIEHGTEYDGIDPVEVTMNYLKYMVYPGEHYDDSYRGMFSGVVYEKRGDLNLIYYLHYKDGLRDGEEVRFYDSGKVDNYRFWKNSRLVGKVFGWYENGKIKNITDWDQKTCIEFDENGGITYQGTRY